MKDTPGGSETDTESSTGGIGLIFLVLISNRPFLASFLFKIEVADDNKKLAVCQI